jgi:hypothetical protein
LTDEEWNAIAKSIGWAKDRFEILKSTEMVGGDPGNKQAYGYVHFFKDRGIAAVRNPFIQPRVLEIKLDPAYGLCSKASSLVLERVYPTRWVSPHLFAAGATLELPLQGYETGIYEIYPLKKATEPLLAGVTFDVVKEKGKDYLLKVRNINEQVRLLNPWIVKNIKISGQEVALHQLQSALSMKPLPGPVKAGAMTAKAGGAEVDFSVKEPSTAATLVFLVEPLTQANVSVYLQGKKIEAEEEHQEGKWAWYKVKVGPGQHNARIKIQPIDKKIKWTGKISAWVIGTRKPPGKEVQFELTRELSIQRPMPPLPLPAGEDKYVVKLPHGMGND